MKSPLYNRLKAYHDKNRISFAMPGHKQRGIKDDLLKYDVTELELTENLLHPGKHMSHALELLSDIYKSDKSFISTCGSTIAIHAMIASSLKSGETLLASSDCHMSVVNICAIMGINLRFIPKEYDTDFQIPQKTPSIKEILKAHPDIRACIITSPNYYGICSDIKAIAKECHEHGIVLIVDEAHGAHFIASDKFPQTAMEQGADLSCQSAHKTLNALTGAGYVHIKSKIISPERLHRALCMLHTSSPSYPIAVSADIARAELSSDKWETLCYKCEEIKREICADTKVQFLQNDDPTRLVVSLKNYGISGFEAENILREKYGIDIEMSTPNALVLIITPSNTDKELKAFVSAIKDICKTATLTNIHEPFLTPECPKGLISPAKAFFGKREKTKLTLSTGRICADTVTVYPPGIPILYPGAVIEKSAILYIEKSAALGAHITGMEDGMINVIEE